MSDSQSGFQERLKAARLRLGLTQEALAEELNVTKASVSAWENGREKPGFRLLSDLRAVLGLSLDDLICGSDSHQELEVEQPFPLRGDDEIVLLKAYRKLSSRRRKGLLELLGKF